MTMLLVQNGANMVAFNNEGFAPIHVATINGHLNIVAYFLVNGVDVRDVKEGF
jgi:ankyrin repeat protein